MKPTYSKGIRLKKHHGQYFLRDISVVHTMIQAVTVTDAHVFEIGCGDGFLTREIVAQKPHTFWVFEIDQEWADTVEKEFAGQLTMHTANILDVDDALFKDNAPWVLLSNLPYHVTFPILHKVQKNRKYIPTGVVMMQEEVAQKIVKTGGRGFGYISLFFQYYFDWELLQKVPPGAFQPEPNVHSRLIKFTVKNDLQEIPDEQRFWKFIKLRFAHPRRTLRNNLAQTHIAMTRIPEQVLSLRAQQMNFSDFLTLWRNIK